MSRKTFTLDNSFADRLKILIEDRLDIKQAEFSKQTGISASYLSMILSKRRGPSAEVLVNIFLHYRDYYYWLLTGETDPGSGVAIENNSKRVWLNKEGGAVNRCPAQQIDVDINNLMKRLDKLEGENRELRARLDKHQLAAGHFGVSKKEGEM